MFIILVSKIALFITLLCIIIGTIWYVIKGRSYRGFFPKKSKGITTFRRRDTAAFIGKKLIHKMSALKNMVALGKVKRDSKFKLRRNLAGVTRSKSDLRINLDDSSTRFSHEFQNITKTLTNLFNFENSEILKILEKMKTRSIDKGEQLFNENIIDEMYIVKSGSIELIYTDNLKSLTLKIFEPGEPIISIIFFLEQILLKNNVFNLNKFQAIAKETSIICSIDLKVFKELFCQNPCALARLIQSCVIKLKNAIFCTLCQSFGLSMEYIFIPCEFKNLPEPEDTKFEISEINPEVIIQSISLLEPEKLVFTQDKRLNNEEMFKECVNEMCSILGAENYTILINDGIFLELNSDEIIQEKSFSEGMLYYVFKGSMVGKLINDTNQNNQFVSKKGQFCGLLSILSGMRTHLELSALEKSFVFVITPTTFRKMTSKNPIILQKLVIILLNTFSEFIKYLNFGFKWETYETGAQLYQEGSMDEKIYIVLHGRLKMISEKRYGKKLVVGEFSRNEFVGIEELFEKRPRVATLIASRLTEVIVVKKSFFEFLQKFSVDIMIKIANLLSKNIHRFKYQIDHPGMEFSNYSTIALLPSSQAVPLRNFASELNEALNVITSCTIVDSTCISSHSNPMISKFRYLELLTQLESDNYIILWICDYKLTEWTKKCIMHADLILTVASQEDHYSPNQLEKSINQMSYFPTPQHLVILHREERFVSPDNTYYWISARSWISQFYHIRCSSKIFQNQKIYNQYKNSENYVPPSKISDISRLARRITQTSIGLVLGGGGARGFAHLGVILALEKHGIPIDMVGGCSMGAFLGGIYSIDKNSTHVSRMSKLFSERGNSWFSLLFDLTLPFVSFFSGKKLNSELYEAFQNKKIEDFVLPFYCVSTDITSYRLKIHSCGSVWRACRASMSLLNLIPPLCDPIDNHLLIDGGYLNVLPYDVMFKKGARYVIAVDVSLKSNECFGDYGDELSGWRVLWNKISPFGKKLSIPSINEIQDNLCFINCVKLLDDVQKNPNVFYLGPPVQQYHVLAFQHLHEISKIGFEYTEKRLQEVGYNEPNDLPKLFDSQSRFVQMSSKSYFETDDDFKTVVGKRSYDNFGLFHASNKTDCVMDDYMISDDDDDDD